MTHERCKEMLDGYNLSVVRPKQVSLFGMDCLFHCAPDVWALLRFGDIHLQRHFVNKLATLFEGVKWTTVPSFGLGPYMAAIRASSFHAEIGTCSSSLSLLETFSCSFDTMQGTFEFLHGALA